MAIWQFEVLLIPLERAVNELGGLDAQMSPKKWKTTDWWSQHQPPPDFQMHIAALLPASLSWSPEILMWGSGVSDRIHVCLDDAHERVEEVSIRIDLSRPYQQFAHAICDLAQQSECVLTSWPYRIFAPSFERLMTEISGSGPAHYVRAPREYLEGLARDPNRHTQE